MIPCSHHSQHHPSRQEIRNKVQSMVSHLLTPGGVAWANSVVGFFFNFFLYNSLNSGRFHLLIFFASTPFISTSHCLQIGVFHISQRAPFPSKNITIDSFLQQQEASRSAQEQEQKLFAFDNITTNSWFNLQAFSVVK